MKKKLLLVILFIVTILFTSIIAGCSSGNEKKDTNSSGQQVSKDEEDKEKSQSVEKKTAEKGKIVMYHPSGQFESDTDNKVVKEEIVKRFLEDTNIDLTLEAIDAPWAGYEDKVKLAIAGGEAIDSFPIWQSAAMTFINNGMIMPLDELLEQHGSNIKGILPKDSWKFTEVNGKIYGIPRIAPTRHKPGLTIRKDWLQKYSLQMPASLDDLYNVAKVFKQNDPVGNGKTVPLLLFYSYHELMNIIEPNSYYIGEDGKVYNKLKNPDAKVILDWWRKCYAEGLLPADYFVMKDNDKKNLIKSGAVGIWNYGYQSYQEYLPKIRQIYPDAKIGMVPLKSIAQPGKIAWVDGPVVSDFILIPANSKNAETVIKYYDWLSADKENFYLANYGIENKNWKRLENGQIDLIGPKDENGRSKDYNGFYTGMFDLWAVKGYGRGIEAGVVKPVFPDNPGLQSIYDNELMPAIEKIMALPYSENVFYGFTPSLSGIAKQTASKRSETVYNAVTKYLAGGVSWEEVQKAIDDYCTSPGGPEEIQQITEQYNSWKSKWSN